MENVKADRPVQLSIPFNLNVGLSPELFIYLSMLFKLCPESSFQKLLHFVLDSFFDGGFFLLTFRIDDGIFRNLCCLPLMHIKIMELYCLFPKIVEHACVNHILSIPHCLQAGSASHMQMIISCGHLKISAPL